MLLKKMNETFNKLKGGFIKMARNLTNKEPIADVQPQAEQKVDSKQEEKPIQVITENMYIINQINLMMLKLEEIELKMLIGFKQCGVKYEGD